MVGIQQVTGTKQMTIRQMTDNLPTQVPSSRVVDQRPESPQVLETLGNGVTLGVEGDELHEAVVLRVHGAPANHEDPVRS